MKSIIILGRQPSLGLAELESLFGSKAVQPLGSTSALLNVEAPDVPFARLGGSVKLARILTEIYTVKWQDIETYLTGTIPSHLKYVPDGKLRLGLSVYGLKTSAKEVNATGLRLKKTIKETGRSVRIIPNRSVALNSAQVIHNRLTEPTGWELLLIGNGRSVYLAQTYAEQDIEAYARRDQNRPKRDARVGMLPPKLAQVIINLAKPDTDDTVLDPFCGTGVILQETALMRFNFYGSDIDERMVQYAKENIKWLQSSHNLSPKPGTIEVGDATNHHWTLPINRVASETYLGKPLSSLPPNKLLDNIRNECEVVLEGFLRNVSPQLKNGARLCLAVPAWKTKSGFLHLKTLDRLGELGYNRLSFVHASSSELVYHRPDQIVARELVVLAKK